MIGPIRREEQITRVYWECAIQAHRHQTEVVAMRCINARPVAPAPRKKWTDEAILSAARSYAEGATLKTVGQQNGVGIERIRQVFAKALRRDRRSRPSAWDGFDDLKPLRDHVAVLVDVRP